MDVVSGFAIFIFSIGWYFYAQSDADEPLSRLFFGTIMGMGASIGLLGIALRWLTGRL